MEYWSIEKINGRQRIEDRIRVDRRIERDGIIECWNIGRMEDKTEDRIK
jgi:hypothetical protein